MRNVTLAAGIVALIAGSTASASPYPLSLKLHDRGYLDESVQTGIYIGNRPAPNLMTPVSNFRNTHFETPATVRPNESNTTLMPSTNAAFPNVNVTIDLAELDAFTRRVSITWETVDGTPFVPVGTQAANGTTTTDLIFTFGMSHLGMFPSSPTGIFDDDQFIQVISSTGQLFNDSGASIDPIGLFLAEEEGTGFYGRVFFQRRSASTGQPNLLDFTELRAQRYVAEIVYVIPAPGAMALLGISGLAVARRRRR